MIGLTRGADGPAAMQTQEEDMKTNRQTRTLFCIVFGILTSILWGCSADLNPYGNTESDGYIQLDLAKSGITRADLGEDGSGSFVEGDRVGLYIDNGTGISYRELILEGGEWLPKLKRQDFGSGQLKLSAHYPTAPGISDIAGDHCEFEVELDQSGEGKDKSDLLVAQTVLEEGQNRACLTFRHAMHRLRIELSGQTDNVDIAVRSRTRGVVNLLTGAAVLTGSDFRWITPSQNADGSFEAVIYPQDAAPFRDGDGSLLRITKQGKEAYFKAPDMQTDGNDLDRFEAGKQITVKLSLKESADNEWANRKVWVYGITAPEESAWKQLYPEFYSTYYLPWDKSYGWYDCNKMNPTARPEGIPDGMMCWAASGASILHWWFDQNRKYIEMYDYQGPDYHWHESQPSAPKQESDIFQCFIDSFADEAGYPDAGLNWFVHGDIPTLPALEYPYNPGGYFKDVFPQTVRLSKNFGGLGKERFNELVKDALANKKAISIARGSVTSGHILTIWGAEFDENGDVSYVYMADNNDRDQFEAYGVGCIRAQIAYMKYPEGATYTCYLTGYIEDNRAIAINRLITMELGENYWKDYLGL